MADDGGFRGWHIDNRTDTFPLVWRVRNRVIGSGKGWSPISPERVISMATREHTWCTLHAQCGNAHDDEVDTTDFPTDYVVTRDFLGWSRIERVRAKIYQQL